MHHLFWPIWGSVLTIPACHLLRRHHHFITRESNMTNFYTWLLYATLRETTISTKELFVSQALAHWRGPLFVHSKEKETKEGTTAPHAATA